MSAMDDKKKKSRPYGAMIPIIPDNLHTRFRDWFTIRVTDENGYSGGYISYSVKKNDFVISDLIMLIDNYELATQLRSELSIHHGMRIEDIFIDCNSAGLMDGEVYSLYTDDFHRYRKSELNYIKN